MGSDSENVLSKALFQTPYSGLQDPFNPASFPPHSFISPPANQISSPSYPEASGNDSEVSFLR